MAAPLPDITRTDLQRHDLSVPGRKAACEPSASRREPMGTPTRRAVLKGTAAFAGLPPPPVARLILAAARVGARARQAGGSSQRGHNPLGGRNEYE
jgi:hypothetical protein